MPATKTAPKKSKAKARNTAPRQPKPEVKPQPKQDEFVMSDEQSLHFTMYTFRDKISKINRRLESAIQLLCTHDSNDEPFDGQDAFAVETAVSGASRLLVQLREEITSAVTEFMRLYPWEEIPKTGGGHGDEFRAAMKMIAELPPEARRWFVFNEPGDGSQIDDVYNLRLLVGRSVIEMENSEIPLVPFTQYACAMAKAMPSHVRSHTSKMKEKASNTKANKK